ncbi:TspO/MBR family protein [Stenotrophomonas sp. C2852]|uniref:TspO/MBR family protein n=1 Tax=Stenotrophomonas sp. C2852 TaxID=3077845 RepID=UPI00293C622E|nr:TspO/MBR family protein [Stenotrophomonas sp. C2852]MDV3434694.1 TspO/MBR family protein [Stenotrophomonas sp. C2852]
MKRSSQVSGLLAWGAITFVAAALGGWASTSAASFYATLALPSWAPPASVFGPVWTLLYAMMALAAWLAWRERGWRGARPALVLYLLQLAVNALWSWLFFDWKLGALAFADILVLIVLVCATIVAFARIRPVAAVLLLPYLAWISFASALNFAVWRANPGLL